ncbi:cell division control protein 45 homolog [Hyalella azteca]|uniref:Cell division control protein 45 homolog n=1 Tax=Hyalella azteca TaxID=294128 RepID=A0A8B7N5I6_HYAAZ|nr:cell division control protein 45 homolog [Hyalella azteca]
MFVTNIIKEFYDCISGKRVLVLVHSDLDAICSGKILQALFRADHILYTLCPVLTLSDLLTAVKSHKEQISSIILINCGGTLDLVEFLELPPHIKVFLADTHRPLHVCNIYSDDQIRILGQLDDDEEVPAFGDVFRDDETSESEEEDEDGVSRISESRLEKQRERRLWEQKRNKLLFDYSQFSYFAGSTATLMFELAWKLSKDTSDLLWLAIVSLSGEQLCSIREQHKLALCAADLNTHVARLHHTNHTDTTEPAADTITFQKDVQLSLYRHWSLVESMRHSPLTATSLKLWTHKGEKKMFELLAELGLPLTECRQLFCGMDVKLRSELPTLLEGKADKYGLGGLVTPSFSRSHVFHSRCSASDFAHAALALLEPPSTDGLSMSHAFLDASDCLNGSTVFAKGIASARKQLEAVYRQMQTFLDMNQVISAGPFLYATVLQGSPLAAFMSGPHVLGALGRFTLGAHVSASRNKKARSLPLVLTTPDSSQPQDWCLVCGIPPLADTSHRNFFGKAFEQAVSKTQSRAQLEFFDSHVIRLHVEDRSKFFDALISLLS